MQRYCGTSVNSRFVAAKIITGFSHVFGNGQLNVFLQGSFTADGRVLLKKSYCSNVFHRYIIQTCHQIVTSLYNFAKGVTVFGFTLQAYSFTGAVSDQLFQQSFYLKQGWITFEKKTLPSFHSCIVYNSLIKLTLNKFFSVLSLVLFLFPPTTLTEFNLGCVGYKPSAVTNNLFTT